MSFGRDWLRCCRRSRISTSPAKQAVGEDALAALHEVGADVILLDLEMPGLDGIQTLGAMDEAGMTTPVIVFTVFDTDNRIVDAVQAGARGYLLKVLRILATGQQNKEIADVLSISERTVKFHVSALLWKLGAGNRTEAVAIASERKIIQRGGR